MRLLNCKSLELQEFTSPDVPPYAILSHTWRSDEITFPEMVGSPADSPITTSGMGYHKLRQCCYKAAEHRLDWVWIDTCCIDRTSSAEMSEAINSMFAWYQKSTACFVYLADMMSDDPLDFQSLSQCRWFTRGWTLIELLAPARCYFFNTWWRNLGTREELSGSISKITKIERPYLEATQNSREAPCSTKMRWLSQRRTTRVEDMAYCMLGLFDIHMPPIYGEGEKAFNRLQEEVLEQTGDTTVFSWYWDASVPDNWQSIFAPRPALFDPSLTRPPAVYCQDDERWKTIFEAKSGNLIAQFSVNRRVAEYGAGIHAKPDEFPPHEELEARRYHYLRPRIRMPINIFLHYLHRARWTVWGEHAEDTWLQRLPKKLNKSVLAEMARQENEADKQQQQKQQQQQGGEQQEEEEAVSDPNLAFGWGVHIIDGPNHAVLGLLLVIGTAVSFIVSGMVVGIAKTQEQGFGIGSFLLAIVASGMAAIYFRLQDE